MIIETNIIECSGCGGTDLVKNGKTSYSSQRYLCKGCRASRVNSPVIAEIDIRALFILKGFRERLSLRGIMRVFGVSWGTLYGLFSAHVKSLFPNRDTLADPDPEDALEFDELWSFVGSKKEKRWVWVAISRKTRQVVGWAVGGRGRDTFKRLLRKIPDEYLRLQSYSDHWKAYDMLVAKGNHLKTGKEEGQTCHIERWNCTLRQRMSRFVRKSLAFSKKDKFHLMALKLFIWFYNMEILNMSDIF